MNIIKGWFTTIIGIIGFGVVLAHWTGFFVLPNPKALDTDTEAISALIVCLAFALMPSGYIEEKIKVLFEKITGK